MYDTVAHFAVGFFAFGIVEYLVARRANFLGSQGDIWDAQKDMLMDTLGAVTAVVVFLVTRRRAAPARPSTRQ